MMAGPYLSIPESLVRAMCTDCDREVAGCLALRALVVDGVPGLEINISEGGRVHPICRVPFQRIPGLSAVVIHGGNIP